MCENRKDVQMNKAEIYPWIFAWIIIFLFFSIGTASAKTWYVDDSGGADFTEIQDAVDAASKGDMIIVKDGIYNENIEVNKQLTIESENGADRAIVRAKYSDPVFEIAVDYVVISGFTIEGIIENGQYYTDAGIYLASETEHCTISHNNILNTGDGIILDDSSSNKIMENNVSLSDWCGISLYNSNNNTIMGNSANSNDMDGIHLSHSSNNAVIGNSISSNNCGIYLHHSSDNTIIGNSANSNTISTNWSANLYLRHWQERYYTTSRSSGTCSEHYGIYLGYSSNNKLSSNNITNNEYGIPLLYSYNNKIENNQLENDGIFILGDELSHYTTHEIKDNTINGKPIYYYKNKKGIKVPEDAGQIILTSCDNMIIENANISFSCVGIELAYTKNSKILKNNIINTYHGIYLLDSSSNKISNNNVLNNKKEGIYLSNSFNNTITNNSALNNDLEGIRLLSSSNNIITNNKVLKNDFGFYIYKSSNNNIINNNNISLNIADGIVIESASNNEITKNNINSNGQRGISIVSTKNNKIYLNNFINNTDTTPFVGLDVSNNWNSPEEIPYTYSGSKYTNYLGNYWGDYEGTDENNDGIGDTPYVIEDYRKFNGIIKKDKYPLMTSFENYVSIPEMPFDTIDEDNTRLILYGVVLLLIIVAIGCGIPASRRKRKGWHEQKIKEYKAKVEQWKREGYKVDELEEMLK